MAPFPVPASHWHVFTPRRLASEADRLSRDQALWALRQSLITDSREMKDARFAQAVEYLDAGWTTARVGAASYVAFACACPELPAQLRWS